ncbi:Crp/Fnr family transcriptional regulator [Methylobacterium sp. J-048]|uniref:Crp/Fnr family transcriptional regulator n=1 Tax=Methylobacterium sp. J-048 TaxID=2836635 RepID=UPI001FB8B609|nr:Crp/Fnr family transcriptional regulator [Methylobacterium sp. J-048]MCJ2057496.1 Crp/Fnr family transcriptional regulator [Methylobacterium sp. J-048]
MTALPRRSAPHPFVRKVESVALFTLTEDERAALCALPMQVAQFDAYRDIVREGDRPARCFAVLDGFVSTYKTTLSGKRQIAAFHVPGDVPDIQSLHLKLLDNSISSIGPCRVGFVQHDAMRALFQAHPRIGDVFWRISLIDAALVRQWILNTGRREAYPRMAHLFCEVMTRLDVVGLAPERTCSLPMTQHELADALGITPVHVNRTLGDLTEAGLITLRSRRLTVHDWDRLTAIAEFDPTYLHLGCRDSE